MAWHNVILSDCSLISMHTKVGGGGGGGGGKVAWHSFFHLGGGGGGGGVGGGTQWCFYDDSVRNIQCRSMSPILN